MGRFKQAMKQTGWHKAHCCSGWGSGLVSNEWLQENIEWLNYSRDMCNVLVTSRPWKSSYIDTKKIQ